MKFKSLYYQAVCTVSALTFVSCLSGCTNGGGDDLSDDDSDSSAEVQAEAYPHMQMTAEQFASGQKQFALRAVVTGAIYATGSYVQVSDTKADNIWGQIVVNGVATDINMMYEAANASPSSDSQLRISFTNVADTGIEEIFHAFGATPEDIPGDIIYKPEDAPGGHPTLDNNGQVNEDLTDVEQGDRRKEYDYVITISFHPIGQTFSANCAVIAKSGETLYNWVSSGLYYVEDKGTPTTSH